MGRACEQASCLLLLRGRRHVTVRGLMHEQTMRGLMHEQTQAGLACTSYSGMADEAQYHTL